MRPRLVRAIAIPLFFLGALLAISVAIVAAWGDYEGLSYFATGAAYDAFRGLHCPIVLGQAETGTVSAAFSNASDETIHPFYEVEISGLAASRQFEGNIAVGPRSTRDVTWTVDARDIDLRYFILVKLDVLPMAGFRSRQATCGILVLPVAPLSGETALLLVFAVSLFCMLAGQLLPSLGITPAQAASLDRGGSTSPRRLMQALGICSVLAMLAGFAGWWLAALVLCVLCVLLVAISLRYMTA